MDATDYKFSERKDLISKDKGEINSLISNIFDVPKNSLIYENPNFVSPVFYETDKLGIFTYMKGGSSLVTTLLNQYELGNKEHKQDIFSDVFYESMGFDKDIDSKEKIKFNEFYKILDGTSEKDLIIPIRNSCKKWVSGVIQELKFEYNNSPLLKRMLGKGSVYHISELSQDNINELVLNKMKNLQVSENGLVEGHHMLYNETLYNFLEFNPNIDKTKLRIIDIDSSDGDLRKLISEYHPEVLKDGVESFQSHRDFYVRFLNSINNQFMNTSNKENKQIADIMKRVVGQDYYYYTLIHKKYYNLIYK